MLSESTLKMQIPFNHPVIVFSPLISQSFSLRKPSGADTALLTVITGYKKKEGEEFTSALLCQCERIPIDVLSETRNGGHMGHPPLLCNIQRDVT